MVQRPALGAVEPVGDGLLAPDQEERAAGPARKAEHRRVLAGQPLEQVLQIVAGAVQLGQPVVGADHVDAVAHASSRGVDEDHPTLAALMLR